MQKRLRMRPRTKKSRYKHKHFPKMLVDCLFMVPLCLGNEATSWKTRDNVWCKLFCTRLLSISVNIPMKNWDTETYNIFHFEVFGMLNLHYEISICQKIYNRVTTHNKSKCLVRNSLHQTLAWAALCAMTITRNVWLKVVVCLLFSFIVIIMMQKQKLLNWFRIIKGVTFNLFVTSKNEFSNSKCCKIKKTRLVTLQSRKTHNQNHFISDILHLLNCTCFVQWLANMSYHSFT